MSLDTILTVIATGIILFSIFAIVINRKKKQVPSPSPEEKDEKRADNETNEMLYKRNRRLAWSTVIAVYIAIILITFTFWPTENSADPVTGTMLTILFHFLASWRMVGATELGAILFFGKPLYPVDQGLRFVPWLVCQLSKETRLLKQYELPTEPEKIFRGPRNEPEVVPENLRKEGFRPPIRITFAGISEEAAVKTEETKKVDTGATPKEGAASAGVKTESKGRVAVDDPLQERVTAETPIVVWLRIVDYIRFLTTIGDIDEARKQMEDAAVKVLSQHFPKITVAEAFKEKEKYDKEVLDGLKIKTASWGVEVDDAAVKNILLSHELSIELQKIAEARAKKRRDKLEGEGAGAKEQGTLDGRTAGLVKMKRDLAVSGHAVLAAETARGITSNPGQKTVIVGAAGIQELLGVVVAAGKTLETVKDEKGGAT